MEVGTGSAYDTTTNHHHSAKIETERFDAGLSHHLRRVEIVTGRIVAGVDCGGPRFGKAYTSHAPASAVPVCIYSEVRW